MGASFIASAIATPGMSTGAKFTTAAVVAADAAVDVSSRGVETVFTGEKTAINVGVDIASSVLPDKALDGAMSNFNKAVMSDLSSNTAATLSKSTKTSLKQAQDIAKGGSFQVGANAVADFAGGLIGGQISEGLKGDKPLKNASVHDSNTIVTDAIEVKRPSLPIRIQR